MKCSNNNIQIYPCNEHYLGKGWFLAIYEYLLVNNGQKILVSLNLMKVNQVYGGI